MTPQRAEGAAATVAAYGSAWAQPDHDKRMAVLEGCWAPQGTYIDPSGRADGRLAFSEHIASFQRDYPGHRLDLTSGVDEHDGYVRFAWKLSGPDGTVLMEGIDFGQLDGDGRLSLICGFFGPLPRQP